MAICSFDVCIVSCSFECYFSSFCLVDIGSFNILFYTEFVASAFGAFLFCMPSCIVTHAIPLSFLHAIVSLHSFPWSSSIKWSAKQ